MRYIYENIKKGFGAGAEAPAKSFHFQNCTKITHISLFAVVFLQNITRQKNVVMLWSRNFALKARISDKTISHFSPTARSICRKKHALHCELQKFLPY